MKGKEKRVCTGCKDCKEGCKEGARRASRKSKKCKKCKEEWTRRVIEVCIKCMELREWLSL
jgi:Fe-S-cluster-containing dehydrogenase component